MISEDYDGEKIPGEDNGTSFLIFFLQSRENLGMNLNQETDTTGDQIRARYVKDNDVTPRSGIGNHVLNVASRWRRTTQPAMHMA